MNLSLRQKAIFALSIVALCYALLSVGVRLSSAGFSPLTQVYLRIGLGVLLTASIFFRKISFSKFLKISSRDWWILVLMGTLGYGLAVDFATVGILYTKLLDVAVIGSTTPFFIFFFSVLVLKKPLKWYLLCFLILAFYGVCVLATTSLIPTFGNFRLGDFYILLFALGLGIYIFGRKMLSAYLNTYEIAVTVMFIAFLSSFIVAMLFRESISVAGFFNPYALGGVVLGGVLNLVAATLETFGFNHVSAVTGSQLMLLENIFAPLFGYFFYHELIFPVEIFGALLVVAGVWLYIKFGED